MPTAKRAAVSILRIEPPKLVIARGASLMRLTSLPLKPPSGPIRTVVSVVTVSSRRLFESVVLSNATRQLIGLF